MNTQEQNYSWKQIPTKDTSALKVGDRVKVISGVLLLAHTPSFFEQNCTVLEIDKTDNTIRLEYCEKHSVWLYLDTLKCESPTPKWLPIDRDNLPSGQVLAKSADGKRKAIITPRLNIPSGLAHYIPLTDLLNLPISE